MYSILYETDDSTAVNLSVYGKFLPGLGKQLVTVGAKCLKFYRVNPYSSVPVEEGDKQWIQSTKLECLLTFSMLAPIRSIAVARVPLYPECDSLVMSFDDAKLSIVNINPKTMMLNTLSLHSIEDDFLRDGYMMDNFSPDLCVDPGQRCVAFLVYGHHLGIVPFSNNSKDQHLHSYTVPLRSFDERLDHVLDMTFLDGYYEPTILFLYEPIKTTAGRASVRYDTISILGVSLNVKDKVHAIVWNFGGLPMTVDRCLQIPLPVGGVCLFGANEIIYLNQSVPPCGLALNSCADEFTKFPLNDCRNLKLTLDGVVAQIESINSIFIGLRNGDFFVLNLDIDQANAVKNIKLQKVFETPIPCSITMCSPGYVFVGSRLGDSVFLKYSRETKTAAVEKSITVKKSFFGTTVQKEPEPINLYNNDDDQFLYINDTPVPARSSTVEKSEVPSFEHQFFFHQLDSLLNVGPCKIIKSCMGSSFNPFLKKKKHNEAIFNMVSASGHGKDASLCFFERTIRPEVTTTSALEEAVQFWSVGRHNTFSHATSSEDLHHRYLIIAKEMSTLVLELENDMVELEEPIFLTSETTVAAGELANGSVVVQVASMSIVLVFNSRQLEMVNIESNFPVVAASINDPFITLLTQNGRILLYRLVPSQNTFTLKEESLVGRMKHEKTPATSICIYRDISGIIQLCSGGKNGDVEDLYYTGLVKNYRTSFVSDAVSNNSLIKEEASGKINDDIDELLYGDEQRLDLKQEKKPQKRKSACMNQDEKVASKLETDVQDPNCVMPTYWLVLTRENGNLYIYSISDVQLVYMIKKFNQLHEVLYDDPDSAYDDDHAQLFSAGASAAAVSQTNEGIKTNLENSIVVKMEEIVMELHLQGMGINQARPILSALIDDTVVFYEMFGYDDGIEGHLAIRFRRLNISTAIRTSKFLGSNGRAPVEAARDIERHRPLIHTFVRIGPLYNGIFVAGGYPSLMLIDRGEPRLHPLTIDGQICSFARFHNVNCPHGFLYLTSNHMMRISLIRSDIIYDASYPVRKIIIPNTVHFVVYLLQSNLYGVITSVRSANNKLCTVLNEDKQIETCERDENFSLPELDRYNLQLFSPEDWSFVPNTLIEMEEFEVVTCCEEVLLASESTVSGMQNYLSVGTAINYGEEVFVRGRIILCEIIEVVPEEGMPTSRHRLKPVYDKEQKGPLSSMCSCNGYLLTGMGQKVFIWQFRDGELNGVSFLDLHFYVHALVGFRNLAVACDLYRSLSLLRYQEEYKALSLVSRDLRPTAPTPMAAHFLVDGSHLGFILSDEGGNVTLFNYLPETKESMGGERLIIRASINVGSLINSFTRIKGHVSECLVENEAQVRETQTCIFATLDGSFGIVRPLTEKIFRRLHMLQQVMTMHVPQPAGLNPRGARSARPVNSHSNQQISSARNIVDGNLVFQYLYLSTQDKMDLARKLGTSRYQIIDDLTEIRRTITPY